VNETSQWFSIQDATIEQTIKNCMAPMDRNVKFPPFAVYCCVMASSVTATAAPIAKCTASVVTERQTNGHRGCLKLPSHFVGR